MTARSAPSRLARLALLAMALLSCALARAEDYGNYASSGQALGADHTIRVRSWGRWTKGFDLGARPFGKFTSGANLNAQPGNVFIHGAAHLWWEHLIEAHASLGIGVPNTTFEYGFGIKLNLLEFLEDPTAELIHRGIQRGFLAKVLQNFMFFAAIDLVHYSFPDPDPVLGVDYATSLWTLQPGLGAQWYFFLPTQFAQRWYIETTISFSRMGPNNYVAPYLGVGIELAK